MITCQSQKNYDVSFRLFQIFSTTKYISKCSYTNINNNLTRTDLIFTATLVFYYSFYFFSPLNYRTKQDW